MRSLFQTDPCAMLTRANERSKHRVTEIDLTALRVSRNCKKSFGDGVAVSMQQFQTGAAGPRGRLAERALVRSRGALRITRILASRRELWGSLLSVALLLPACSCSSSSDSPATTKPDAWTPPVGIEQCDKGRDRRCLHADADADGVSVAQGDCDDADPVARTNCTVVPTTPAATCEGTDCRNADQDGDGLTPAEGDCDDTNELISPLAPDPCGDGVDGNCDGFDSDCEQEDADGDGVSPADGDCDDANPASSTKLPEICGDGVDNDCQGGDLACESADQDGDGSTPEDGDCDDSDAAVSPLGQEVCGDGVDNDCDGSTDLGCAVGPGDPISVTLSSDQPITLSISAKLPDPQAGDVGADVMFLVDQSASFEDDVETFKTSATEILTRLSGTFGDLRVGVASFRDAPCLPFGPELEWAYKLNLPLTDDLPAFAGVMDMLATAPGATTPEAALEGMGQVLTGRGHVVNGFKTCDVIADIAPTRPGWLPARIPILIVSTDAPFNRPGEPDYPYPTSVAEVIELATASRTRIYFMISGERDPEDQLIADATGGQVFDLANNSDGIVTALGTVLDSSISDVEVELVPDGVGAQLIESVSPMRFEGVNLLVDDVVEFEVTFKRTVTRKTRDQVFTFDLVLKARGIESARIPVTVVIPGIDV